MNTKEYAVLLMDFHESVNELVTKFHELGLSNDDIVQLLKIEISYIE